MLSGTAYAGEAQAVAGPETPAGAAIPTASDDGGQPRTEEGAANAGEVAPDAAAGTQVGSPPESEPAQVVPFEAPGVVDEGGEGAAPSQEGGILTPAAEPEAVLVPTDAGSEPAIVGAAPTVEDSLFTPAEDPAVGAEPVVGIEVPVDESIHPVVDEALLPENNVGISETTGLVIVEQVPPAPIPIEPGDATGIATPAPVAPSAPAPVVMPGASQPSPSGGKGKNAGGKPAVVSGGSQVGGSQPVTSPAEVPIGPVAPVFVPTTSAPVPAPPEQHSPPHAPVFPSSPVAGVELGAPPVASDPALALPVLLTPFAAPVAGLTFGGSPTPIDAEPATRVSRDVKADASSRSGMDAPTVGSGSETPLTAPVPTAPAASGGLSAGAPGGAAGAGVAVLACLIAIGCAMCMSRRRSLSAAVWRPVVFCAPLERPG